MTSAPFQVTGPLPGLGTHVLEASAGTGKTYTIAALAARYVADGLPLGQLMMITFSRAATGELRERIRARLTDSEAALERALAGGDPGTDDVDRLLCDGSAAVLAARLQNITAALADFDAAAITTTHEFCGRMLDGLGILAGNHADAVHVENTDDLVREVAADFWLRAFGNVDAPDFSWAEALDIAAKVSEFDGPLAPDPERLPAYARQLGFAAAVRREVGRRRAALGLFTYADLQFRLRDLLRGRVTSEADPDPELAEAVRASIRHRFPVVLVDEFQDTDPVQWEILDLAFSGNATMILIGDPKQAVYGFRHADVNAYLAAIDTAGAQHYTLDTNWRSDGRLVEALLGWFGGARLGDERIAVRPVRAHHEASRWAVAAPELQAPIRLRTLPAAPKRGDAGPKPSLRQLRQAILEDLVADVGRILTSEVALRLPGAQTRPLRPGDIAVLVRANWAAEEVRAALAAAGIPAVHTGASSVFATQEARDWLTLLRACESSRAERVRETALTCFLDWGFVDLVNAEEDQLGQLSARIRSWSHTLADQGVAGLVEAMLGSGLAERILQRPDGARSLTDLRHVGEILHTAQVHDRLGTSALVDWFADQIEHESEGGRERVRRIETDQDAVRVMTIHQAKGLEFPVVYLPDQWDAREPDRDSRPFTFHHDGRRHLYLAPGGSDRAAAWRVALADQAAESLRLLYVAATRAQCQLVAWWAGSNGRTPGSPLHRMLFRAGDPNPRRAYPCETSPADLLHPPGVAVQQVGIVHPGAPPALADPLPDLRPRIFNRAIDTEWRRTSYSGLTARAHDAGAVGSPTETREDDELHVVSDEPESEAAVDVALAPTPSGALAAESPMARLPRGPAFGNLVHAIYETFDPGAADLAAEVESHATQWLSRMPVGSTSADPLSAPELSAALLPAIRTSLGPIADGLRLCDLPARDRLAELDFEYALAGGDRPTRRVLLAEVAELLRRHLRPADPLAAYADRLGDPLLADEVLRGYLVGSIDAVFRVGGDERTRYLIVDYKTNWLGPLDSETPLRIGHYTPTAMARAMMDAHYPLQALLYSVALHRFLRWRLSGYRAEDHLGGIAYLFVRGMAGPDTPVVDGMPCGVFTWQPPTDLILELSDLLAARPQEAG